MKSLPRLQPLPVPEGYFDTLPEKILNQKQEPTPISVEEEALLYIESGQWSTEDILSMSDNPNELLDQIIEEELSKTEPLWTEEETWY
ncbi:MAG: hypothetical protein LW685_03635 [Algoriphagus sp.]|nr:hypothetical protein [Algoriphagus sp.]